MGQVETRRGHGAASVALEVARIPDVLGPEGNLLTENEHWAKLRLVVEAARKDWASIDSRGAGAFRLKT
jgi:hypothetical protein